MSHNQNWNLIPADGSFNPSKSNRIPVLDYYLPKMAKVQHKALRLYIPQSGKRDNIHGNLSVHLSDGCVNNTALLDAICSRDATPEDFGDSCYTIFIMFLWYHLGRYLCRLLFSILEE